MTLHIYPASNRTKINNCRGKFVRFKVIVHSPFEPVHDFFDFIYIPLSFHKKLIIEPEIIKTTESLRNYNVAMRQCYLRNERPLRFFKTYTQHNCEIECLANATNKGCECVPFFLPSKWRKKKLIQKSRERDLKENFLLFIMQEMKKPLYVGTPLRAHALMMLCQRGNLIAIACQHVHQLPIITGKWTILALLSRKILPGICTLTSCWFQ